MRYSLLLVTAALILTMSSTAGAAVEIPLSCRTGPAPSTPGGGLNGFFYDSSGNRPDNNTKADAVIAAGSPEATFVSTQLDYPNGDIDTSDTTRLDEFLGTDSGSLSGAGTTVVKDVVFHFTGFIKITSLSSPFSLGSDDGSRFKICDTTVIDNGGLHTFQSKTETVDVLQAGLYPVDIIFYQGELDVGIEWSDGAGIVSASVLYRAVADLSVTKTDGVTSAVPGESITYTIIAANAGPSDADATVTDAFDASVLSCIWTCAPTGGASCPPGQVEGEINHPVALPVGGTATYTAVCTINPSVSAATLPSWPNLENEVTITPKTASDPFPANDSAVDLDTVLISRADLEVTKSAVPEAVYGGGEVFYTIVVTNHGPSTASGVVITDTLPPGVTPDVAGSLIFADGFESGDTSAWSAAAGRGALAVVRKASCTADGGTVTCLAWQLGSGASETVVFSAVVDPGTTGTLTNTVTVTSDAEDPDLGNNTATVDSTITTGHADLGVTISDAPDPVAPGGTLTYTLVVTNAGPLAATGVTLTHHLPPEVAFLSATSGQGSCVPGSPAICNLGTLAVGVSITVEIRVLVSPTASEALTAPASVLGDQVDLNPSNDTDTETTGLAKVTRSGGSVLLGARSVREAPDRTPRTNP